MELDIKYKGMVVYSIVNLISNDIYIGSSVNLKKRIGLHIGLLKKNKHHSKHLQNAWNKYGSDNFKLCIIEFISDKNDLIKREQVWIDFFRPSYNICKTSGSTLGVKPSDEIKLKISNSLKGREISKETRVKMSLNSAKTMLGKKHSDETIELLRNLHKGKPKSDEFKIFTSNRMSNLSKIEHPAYGKNIKPIYQYSLDGEFIKKWESGSEMYDNLKYNRGLISACCLGKRRQAYGFQWKSEKIKFLSPVNPPRKNVKEIKILDLKSNIIYEFSSIKEATNTLNICRNSLMNQNKQIVKNPRQYKIIN